MDWHDRRIWAAPLTLSRFLLLLVPLSGVARTSVPSWSPRNLPSPPSPPPDDMLSPPAPPPLPEWWNDPNQNLLAPIEPNGPPAGPGISDDPYYPPPGEIYKGRSRPPSPPPPSPYTQRGRSAPAEPPPTPVTADYIRTLIQQDLPQIVAGVQPTLDNDYAASTQVLLGTSFPVARNKQGDVIVGAARYGKGMVLGFGALHHLTLCCAPPASDPGFDQLVASGGEWAGSAAGAGKATLRVSSKVFEAAARFIVARSPKYYNKKDNPRSRVVPVAKLAASVFTSKPPRDVRFSVYIMGAYEMAYTDKYVQAALRAWVRRGNGLIVAGPDAMPTYFYYHGATAAHRLLVEGGGAGEDGLGANGLDDEMLELLDLQEGGGSLDLSFQTAEAADEEHEAGAESGGSGELLQAQTQRGDGAAAVARRLASASTSSSWSSSTADADGGDVTAGRRALLQVKTYSAEFSTDSVQVNAVTGPMGIVFSGDVSNPGGALKVGEQQPLSNADLAAQQYLAYLHGALVLSPTQLEIVTTTLTMARLRISRGTPGTDSFWRTCDATDAIAAAKGLPAGAIWTNFPPPPAHASRPAVSGASAPTPLAGSLPQGVSYEGCFTDDTRMAEGRALPVLLTPSLDRANSVTHCLELAKAYTASGAPGGPIVFMGLQRFQCWGGNDLSKSQALGGLDSSKCNMRCPGATSSVETCGGAIFSWFIASSVYRIL